MNELLKGKTRKELVEMIEQLSMECDERHAREDALEEQVRSLGAIPVKHTFLNPPGDIEPLEGDAPARDGR